jgi:hypothetical protein
VFDIEQCLYKYTFLLSFSNIVYQCVDIKGTVARKEKKEKEGGKEGKHYGEWGKDPVLHIAAEIESVLVAMC